ncbi:hypothetical protein BpHYR1_002797 [Brachionus plicatilis]|uniref:Uncharacterized protein n=1 Tax=Brachionus plicatilis TaxID=10195 RepID=A0A3M7P9U7_BRAPC|nr:hypothetical protein BpHYR1_002797 [Brachionus plicatilis]
MKALNNQLYLITDDVQTIKFLNGFTWPKKASLTGITKATPKEKVTFIAIRGVDISINVED